MRAAPASAGWRSPWLLHACAWLLVGIALRVHVLREQIVLEDELLSLLAPLQRPYAVLFGAFDPAYYSLPHAALLKLLADSVGLDELTLRLPSLAAGLALLIVAPWLAWRRFGPAAAALFAALLAISPVLVLYSRVARSYAIATLFVFLAVMALERWLAEHRPRHAQGYVACAVLAIWFHQLAAPALLAPLAVAAALCVRDAAAPSRWREGAAPLLLGAAVLLIVALLHWNAWFSSGGMLAGKVGTTRLHAQTLLGAMRLFAGSDATWLVLLFWLGAALGAAIALRRQRTLASLVLASLLAQWLAVGVLGPWITEVPRIFMRYVVFGLPFVLVFLALALAELARIRLAERAPLLPVFAGSLFAALLYGFGPLPRIYYEPNNFTTHPDFQELLLAQDEPAPAVPAFYRTLREEAGDFAIAVAPWQNSRRMVPYHVYQHVHGKRVRIAFLGALLDPPVHDEFPLRDPRVAFRTFVDVTDLAALRAADVRYVVLHRKLGVELGYPALSLDLDPVIARLAPRFGPPVYQDEWLAVFAVPPPEADAPAPAAAAAPQPG